MTTSTLADDAGAYAAVENVARPSDAGRVLDRHVGARMRWRRKALELSQLELALAAGITLQHANMYESGLKRISAGCLLDIADALDVPVAWFFEDCAAPGWLDDFRRQPAPLRIDDMIRHEQQLNDMARALTKSYLARGSDAGS